VRGKLARPVREEADGKGPGHRHLAGGRLYSGDGPGETDRPQDRHRAPARPHNMRRRHTACQKMAPAAYEQLIN
jgi:hypothetical protein